MIRHAERAQVKHVWVAEVAYKYSRWITLWTTCRLTMADCWQALHQHSSARDPDEYAYRRVVKFVRGGS